MLALVCVIKGQRGHILIERAGHFAVNVLTSAQKELGIRFASASESDRFAGLDVQRASTGAPILPGSLAWLDCELRHTYPGGDHTIFVGEAVAGNAHGGDEALVYFNRRWGSFSG
jgi:flavin reductase (DIM6/NTAB) family NADH-FMN oxidoreductase RutF